MQNLWNIKKTELKKDISDSPHAILREQIEFFRDITDDNLQIRMKHIKLKGNDIEYSLGTNFDIVAPMLDGYTYTLFTIFTKPESSFPVLIFLNNGENDYDKEDADFVCKNKDEFLKYLGDVLSSEKTHDIIKTLYLKSNL